MILADTSAWVESDRATGSPVHLRLTRLIRTGGTLAVIEPVVMEVLAGARNEERENDLRRLLLRFELLRFDVVTDFDGAVGISRRCRQAGVTRRRWSTASVDFALPYRRDNLRERAAADL